MVAKRKHSKSRKGETQFNSVVLRGATIKIGEVVKVRCEDESEGLGTVVAINLRCQKKLLKIRWFYSPKELNLKNECFGVAEVFDSKKQTEISIECVEEKAYVLSVEEYNSLDHVDECTFYSRAAFVSSKKQLDPPITAWATMCICQQVINPDVPMIQCEECLEYFHSACFKLPFVCPNCFI